MIQPFSPLRRRYLCELERVKHLHRGGASGMQIVQELTIVLDQLIAKEYEQVSNELSPGLAKQENSTLCLAALGSYGREHLNPYSDVDITFLYVGRLLLEEERVVKKFLQNLWDAGFAVGHACRSLEQSVRMANEDSTVKTALGESRYLLGNHQVYGRFRDEYRKKVLDRKVTQYISEKIEERRVRYEKHGSTHCVQEPNLKEGAGGIRDFHHGIWLATACFDRRTLPEITRGNIISREMANRVEAALSTLFRIRNETHFLSSQCNDLLSLDIQCQVAENLGYRDSEAAPNYQPMMDDYYRSAQELRSFADAMERRCRGNDRRFLGLFGWSAMASRAARRPLDDWFYIEAGEIGVNSRENRNPFAEDPSQYLKFFENMLDYHAEAHPDAEQTLADSLPGAGERLRGNPAIAAQLRQFMARREPIGWVLRAMHETGFLGEYLPAIARIRHLVRHDLYHRYPVDEHSFRTLEAGEDLIFGEQKVFRMAPVYLRGSPEAVLRKQALAEISQRMGRLDLIRWALLCHDIGKGFGKGHHQRGADIAEAMLKELGYPDEDREIVYFLILNHLILSDTAFRRDIDDPRTVNQIASQVGSKIRLSMLHLLTIADLTAVADNILSEWKWNLLWQLYSDSLSVMTSPSEEPQEIEFDEAVARLTQEMSDEFPPEDMAAYLHNLPHRYARYLPSNLIRRHRRALAEYKAPAPIVKAIHDPITNMVEVDIIARDRLGLFHDIARAFPPENFNIQNVRLFTSNDGTAIDTVSASGDSLTDDQIRQRLELLEDRIHRNIEKPQVIDLSTFKPLPAPAAAAFKSTVEVYNNISTVATVVDVRSVDRPGLLSVAAGLLSSLGLNIRFASIHTQGQRVVDAFYVTDQDGAKILDKSRIEEIRKTLLAHL